MHFQKGYFQKVFKLQCPNRFHYSIFSVLNTSTRTLAIMSIFGCATGHAVFKLQGEGKLDRKDKVNSGIKDTKMNKSMKFATNVFYQNFAIVKL